MDQALEMTGSQAAAEAAPRDELMGRLDSAIERSQRALFALQHPEGFWQGALEANGEMNSEYIIFNRFMELERDFELEAKLKKHLLEIQQADGSWALFPGGEGDLSTSIESYFALKLTGMRAGDEPMMQARRWVLARGGIARAGALARFYLALMNQVPWAATPALPVEITLLPNWFPLNMYALSSWSRATVFALMLLQAKQPVVPVDWREGVLELYIQPPHFTKFTMPHGQRCSRCATLLVADKACAFTTVIIWRACALPRSITWTLLDHQDANGVRLSKGERPL